MLTALHRHRLALGLSGLGILAVGGQLVMNTAAANIGRSLGKDWNIFTPGYDFWPIWREDHYWVTGRHAPYWYGKGISDAWPPPHEVFFAPLSFLSWAVVNWITIALSATLMVAALWLWAQRDGERRLSSAYLPLALSAPVFAVVWIDQLQSVTGLFMLSLALWAQRRDRWWLVGPAAAMGLIRVPNAIPILAILLLGGWGRWRQLGIALGSGLAFMAPFMFVAFLWDPHWVTDYIAGIASYPFNGPPKVISHAFGYPGLAIMVVLASAAALWLVRKDVGRPLDQGRSSLALALTILISPLGGLYPAIFTLPALVRLGMRPGFSAVPWIAAVVPWLIILAASPWLLAPLPGIILNYLSFIDYGLLVLAYPLLRTPPETQPQRMAA